MTETRHAFRARSLRNRDLKELYLNPWPVGHLHQAGNKRFFCVIFRGPGTHQEKLAACRHLAYVANQV